MHRKIGQPCLFVTGQVLRSHPGRGVDSIQHLVTIGRVPDCGGDGCVEVVDALLLGDAKRQGHGCTDALIPASLIEPSGSISSLSRLGSLTACAGSGGPPAATSTIWSCAELDPMS